MRAGTQAPSHTTPGWEDRMVAAHQEEGCLSTVCNGREQRGCMRGLPTKRRDWRRKEGWEKAGKREKDKEEEKIRGRSEQKRKRERR